MAALTFARYKNEQLLLKYPIIMFIIWIINIYKYIRLRTIHILCPMQRCDVTTRWSNKGNNSLVRLLFWKSSLFCMYSFFFNIPLLYWTDISGLRTPTWVKLVKHVCKWFQQHSQAIRPLVSLWHSFSLSFFTLCSRTAQTRKPQRTLSSSGM